MDLANDDSRYVNGIVATPTKRKMWFACNRTAVTQFQFFGRCMRKITCDVELTGAIAKTAKRMKVEPIRAYKYVLAHASQHLYDLFTVDGFIDSHKSEYKIDDVDHESLRKIA